MVVLPSGAAFLVNRDLPALPVTETYQLWVVTDRRAVSVAVLGPDPAAGAFALDRADADRVGRSVGLAITVEPAGGRAVPGGRRVASSAT